MYWNDTPAWIVMTIGSKRNTYAVIVEGRELLSDLKQDQAFYIANVINKQYEEGKQAGLDEAAEDAAGEDI